METSLDKCELSIKQKIQLKVLGYIRVEENQRKGWQSKALPLYAAECAEHGLYVTHPSGHSNNLVCPTCLARLKSIECVVLA